MDRKPKPRLSTPAYVWFALASFIQVVLLFIVLITAIGGNHQAAGIAVAAFLALLVPSIIIASEEAKRLNESKWTCLRRGYLVGADIFMSLPY